MAAGGKRDGRTAMNRRGPTFHDLWTIAIASVVAMAALMLCLGPPDVDFAAWRQMPAAGCEAAAPGPDCVRQAVP